MASPPSDFEFFGQSGLSKMLTHVGFLTPRTFQTTSLALSLLGFSRPMALRAWILESGHLDLNPEPVTYYWCKSRRINPYVFQFSHLPSGDNNSTDFIRLMQGLN